MIPYTSEAVDLGLSVKWATLNVGAVIQHDYGDYFAWGEVESKESYTWTNYLWGDGNDTSLLKYNNQQEYGIVDNNFELDPDDDPVQTKWGDGWRMPTEAEFMELANYEWNSELAQWSEVENCTWEWTSMFSSTKREFVNGYLITSKKEGFTDRSIFLPAGGCKESNTSCMDDFVCCWTSTLNSDYPQTAITVLLGDGHVQRGYEYRCLGLTVRPVRN